MHMKAAEIIERLKIWGLAGAVSFARRKMHDAFDARRLAKLDAASSCRRHGAAPARGITVVGNLSSREGLSKTLRDFTRSLKEAGIPFQTYDTTPRPCVPAADTAGLVTPPDAFDLHRFSHFVMMYRSPLAEEITRGHACARIVFHDSEHGIHETMPFLRESRDAIIAMSDFNFQYFKRAFPGRRVLKIVYPFRFKLENAAPRAGIRRKYGIGDGDFAVFFNFDFGSYCRKNIPAAMAAFSLAFKGDATAKLVFKSMGARKNRGRVREMEAAARGLGIEKQFVHIPEYMPRADLDGLTAACDAYLSLHRSEGFGIGMAEAMSQGKPVVATGWSANTEFCREDTSWRVPYSMVPILPGEYPAAMKEWAEADPAAAAKMLREIRERPDVAAARAEAGRRFMESHFSIDAFRRDVEAFLSDAGGAGS